MKPQVHATMLEMAFRCGEQFRRRYGARFGCADKEEIIPPSVALITGSAVHRVVEKNLSYKIESGGLLERSQIQDLAADAFDDLSQGDILLQPGEELVKDVILGQNKDMTIDLSVLHHEEAAPGINPISVEEKFVLELEHFPMDLAGQIDIRESDTIRDTKTRKQSPPKDAAMSFQLAVYCLANQVLYNTWPHKVVLDVLVKLKTPKLVQVAAVPHHNWIDPLKERLERFAELIDAGQHGYNVFLPAATEYNWVCSPEYCGYYRTCKYAKVR